MLTARSDAVDRVRGLEAGVDDYLGKPYEPKELLLRIASILRRARGAAGAADGSALRFGPFVFFMERGELRHGEEIVRLTEREREILRLLGASPGASVSREALAGPGATPRSARSTCRSTACAARSNAIRPIRSISRPRAGPATNWSSIRERGGRIRRPRRVFRGGFALARRRSALANVLPKGLYARSLLIVRATGDHHYTVEQAQTAFNCHNESP